MSKKSTRGNSTSKTININQERLINSLSKALNQDKQLIINSFTVFEKIDFYFEKILFYYSLIKADKTKLHASYCLEALVDFEKKGKTLDS